MGRHRGLIQILVGIGRARCQLHILGARCNRDPIVLNLNAGRVGNGEGRGNFRNVGSSEIEAAPVL